jgi:ATP-dependent Clp protease adaptor protein ClpS
VEAVPAYRARRVSLKAMSEDVVTPKGEAKTRTQRPRMYKVLLHNDDYTPREFVVVVLYQVFGMDESKAYSVMMTAHQQGSALVAVYAKDIAETKAQEATELARKEGHPLMFSTEPEE